MSFNFTLWNPSENNFAVVICSSLAWHAQSTVTFSFKMENSHLYSFFSFMENRILQFYFFCQTQHFSKVSYIKTFCFLESCNVILHNQYSAFGEYIRVRDISLFLLLFPPLLRDQKFMNTTVRLSCHFKMFVPEKWKS